MMVKLLVNIIDIYEHHNNTIRNSLQTDDQAIVPPVTIKDTANSDDTNVAHEGPGLISCIWQDLIQSTYYGCSVCAATAPHHMPYIQKGQRWRVQEGSWNPKDWSFERPEDIQNHHWWLFDAPNCLKKKPKYFIHALEFLRIRQWPIDWLQHLSETSFLGQILQKTVGEERKVYLNTFQSSWNISNQ